jgi:hypothetical protein
MRRISLRVASTLALIAFGLSLAACEGTGRPPGFSKPWQDQQQLERGHYG